MLFKCDLFYKYKFQFQNKAKIGNMFPNRGKIGNMFLNKAKIGNKFLYSGNAFKETLIAIIVIILSGTR